MTKKELIEALINSPHPDNTQVTIYPLDKLDEEDLNLIDSLDRSMDNRLELNVTSYK